MEGEQDGAPQEAEERQGQPTELQERETPQAEQPDYKELLNRRGASIAELKAQLAEVAKSKESVDAIAAEIERVRTEASEEKMAYELIRRPTPRGSPVIASERASRSASRGSPPAGGREPNRQRQLTGGYSCLDLEPLENLRGILSQIDI